MLSRRRPMQAVPVAGAHKSLRKQMWCASWLAVCRVTGESQVHGLLLDASMLMHLATCKARLGPQALEHVQQR